MTLSDRVKEALALAKEETEYTEWVAPHKEFKRQLCELVGVPDDLAVPDTLTYQQFAELIGHPVPLTEKIIAHVFRNENGQRQLIPCVMNNWRPDKERIEAIAQELNINLPDIAIWWINGATPENVPIGNNSSQWFKFIADNKERKKRDKELLGSLKLDTSVFGKIPPTELKKPVDGFFSPEHNNKIPAAHFRQEMERKRKEKQRRDEELKNIQVQAHLEALRQFEAEKQQAKKQPETLPDAGAMSVNNDCDFSGFLKIPSRIDDWFCVIDDMVKIFYSQHGKPPNETQAWGQLWTTPPAGYSITASTERGEDCLKMPGVSPLSKSAFSKRWKKYADNSL
ncbi:MAG: hypothetical protein K9L60_02295 [Methylovulum sp.]|nr:hypothetical protein [Methylovulum sp.]MCF7997953.1 hypothetical protein [Methylovulum sp.]